LMRKHRGRAHEKGARAKLYNDEKKYLVTVTRYFLPAGNILSQ
jgi:hypothetical protein